MAKRRIFSEKHKLSAVREFQVSGLTAGEFCKQRGIAGSTFSVWKRRLASSAKVESPEKKVLKKHPQGRAGVDFIPVTLIESKSISATAPVPALPKVDGTVVMEIALPSGGLIRLATNCPPSFLAAALAAMAVQ